MENENKEDLAMLYKRFEALLKGDSLSEEEKSELSLEMLKIIYGSEE